MTTTIRLDNGSTSQTNKFYLELHATQVKRVQTKAVVSYDIAKSKTKWSQGPEKQAVDLLQVTNKFTITCTVDRHTNYTNPQTSLTGTLTATDTDTAITGAGTLFTAELLEGDYITIDSNDYRIKTITDNTNLVLENNFQGVSGSGKSYTQSWTLASVADAHIVLDRLYDMQEKGGVLTFTKTLTADGYEPDAVLTSGGTRTFSVIIERIQDTEIPHDTSVEQNPDGNIYDVVIELTEAVDR